LPSSKILSVKEAAEVLEITDTEVRQLVREGKLNACQSHLRNLRFSEVEILTFKHKNNQLKNVEKLICR